MPPLTFGWVVQPAPRPNMNPTDLHEYNQASLRALTPAFTTIWVEDHFQWEERPTLEAMTTLAYLAAEFPRFTYGSMVLGQSYRNPALLAKMAATLHYLSGGRFILGIGAGWKEDEYHAYGYPYPPASERVAQLAEAVQVIRALWTHSPASFYGAHYTIENAYCEPRPNPAIPLVIGGAGERGTLRVAAQYADGWNFNFGTPDECRHKLDVLRQHCADVGRDFATPALSYYGMVDLPDDPASFAPRGGFYLIGPTPHEAIAQLRPFVEMGISHILVRTTSVATLERFRDEVMPALAAMAH